MMKYVLAVSAFLAFASVARSQQPMEMKKTKQGQATGERTMTTTAKVKAVDQTNRTLTVVEKDGTTETFKVGDDVKRLNEIAPGDTIVVKFRQGLMLQVTPPDGAQPAAAVASSKGDKSGPPSATATAAAQGMVTVAAVDMTSRIVVLQTDSGDMFKVKADPKIQLDRVKAGDKLYGVYTETLAISVEKAKGSPPKTN
jgi:Cu/Ag efflux protein CusF